MTMTRRERRTRRLQRFVSAGQARLAARLARLDYRTSGETGALRPSISAKVWHPGNRPNGHAPPPGRNWSRSGPTYVVEAGDTGRLPKPIIHNRWRKLFED